MLKSLINKYISENVKTDKVALLFSSGMDSLSILLSCLEQGIRPTLYSFYLKSYESGDIINSRKVAQIYGLDLIEICIDDNKENLLRDIKAIIKQFDTKRKTAIQCINPFLYMIPQIKEDVILTGICADDLYGTPRSMAKLSNDITAFNNLRESKIVDVYSSSYGYIKELAKTYKKNLLAPYKVDADITNYFMSLSYRQMHSPKQKNIMYESYKDELLKYGLYRRNSNLQCNSKVREWHDVLLEDTEINKNNNKSVVAIYNRLYEELKNDIKIQR